EWIERDKGRYKRDVVLASVGVEGNREFVKGRTVGRNKKGGIEVNGYMERNVEDVYGGGDCGRHHDVVKEIEDDIGLGTTG
ncbi:FAD-dependent oxidoreductase, partial [Bacillus mycoides]|uniref:FAD-dependent oxidoreductase n=1 Tax=Bacillus mycoides TaxID=1405 RepID=UPI001642EDC4